ncbi:MAG: hypothetical protein WCD70_16920 [Alphaproteobacteria bacterium]
MPQTESPSAKPRQFLRWEITGILIFKLVVIVLASFTVFDASQRLHVDANVVMDRLLTQPAAANPR